MDLPTSVTFFYPRLIPIHNIDPEGSESPAPLRCTIDKMTDEGAYILGNFRYIDRIRSNFNQFLLFR